MADTLAPAFQSSSGVSFTGFAGGSQALAGEIKARVRQGDVFISASPAVNASLEGPAGGGWVSWYASLASTPLVLGYNPRSAFAARLRARPWYDVVALPGFRLGRTDPATDPKGVLAVEALRQAGAAGHAPGLAAVLASSAGVFPEETLVGELQSGQLDAGFFYANEAKAAGIPTVSLAPVSLSATYTITVLNRAAHRTAAEAFVAFLYSARGRAILGGAGLSVPTRPVVRGPAPAVPASLRHVLGSG